MRSGQGGKGGGLDFQTDPRAFVFCPLVVIHGWHRPGVRKAFVFVDLGCIMYPEEGNGTWLPTHSGRVNLEHGLMKREIVHLMESGWVSLLTYPTYLGTQEPR